MLDVLAIAPHPDDAEIGIGASIVLLQAQGHRVGILDLTDGEPTPGGSIELRKRETDAASRILGVQWRRCLGLPNRSLEHTLDARWKLAGLLRQIQPGVLFAPYWEDAHPDHVAATELIEAARFWAKLSKSDLPGKPYLPERIYYYFCSHLRVHERPSFVLDVTEYMEVKMRALACFQSQFGDASQGGTAIRNILEDVRARERYWGWTIGVSYGEPFMSREIIGLRSLPELQ